jgi:hypothetical protein
MSTKYSEDNNLSELSQRFYERARDIANDFNKQLLILSTGVIAALFYLGYNKKEYLDNFEKACILIAITLFGLSILFIVLGMQWDASKNYYLGEINNPDKQDQRQKNELVKREFNTKQLKAKKYARIFFLFGILAVLVFLVINFYR